MAYLTIKKVNGCFYAYMQESYREGGKVRTRTVEYLGALAPAVAQQVQSTRRQLGQADMAALVQSVRNATEAAAQTPASVPVDVLRDVPSVPPPSKAFKDDDAAQSVDNPNVNAVIATAKPLITTANSDHTPEPTLQTLHFPDNLSEYKVSNTALRRTHARFGNRLVTMGVDPAAMPKVEIIYDHPDGFRRNRNGSYTITSSRKPHNKRHQINKTKLWQHTRQAMSLAYLDTLATERPDTHHQLQSTLDESHKATKQMLARSLSGASTPVERLSLSLQLTIWNSVPQKLTKRQSPEAFGQASFETLKDWRCEAAFILSEAHKSGWDGMAERHKAAQRKLRTAITKRKGKIDRMGFLERAGPGYLANDANSSAKSCRLRRSYERSVSWKNEFKF